MGRQGGTGEAGRKRSSEGRRRVEEELVEEGGRPVFEVLPREMVSRVLHLLPPAHLLRAALVCRLWREVVGEARVWAASTLHLTSAGLKDLGARLASARWRRVSRVHLHSVAVDPATLALLATLPLQEVTLGHGCQLQGVEGEEVQGLVAGLRRVEVSSQGLTQEQWCGLLAGLVAAPALAALALKTLPPKFDMGHARQLEQLFLRPRAVEVAAVWPAMVERLVQGGACTALTLHAQLGEVPSPAFLPLLARLVRLDLGQSIVPAHPHLHSILHVLAETTTLRELAMAGVKNLAMMPSRLLAIAFHKLDKLDLSKTRLGTQHYTVLFRMMEEKKRFPSSLTLGWEVAVASLPAPLLLTIATATTHLSLPGIALGRNTVDLVFTAITQGCRLRHLDLSGANLSHLAPRLLSSAVLQLRSANLSRTRLGTAQMACLLGEVARNEDWRLEELDIRENPGGEGGELKVLQAGGNSGGLGEELVAAAGRRLERLRVRAECRVVG